MIRPPHRDGCPAIIQPLLTQLGCRGCDYEKAVEGLIESAEEAVRAMQRHGLTDEGRYLRSSLNEVERPR